MVLAKHGKVGTVSIYYEYPDGQRLANEIRQVLTEHRWTVTAIQKDIRPPLGDGIRLCTVSDDKDGTRDMLGNTGAIILRDALQASGLPARFGAARGGDLQDYAVYLHIGSKPDQQA